ncbi:MAG: pyridoxal-phosphate dependent enzyme [Actinobacteria bacterium]|nr:MAG: pyridoxal-phosphate dependent enzyme [Actinomycetota bacterium]
MIDLTIDETPLGRAVARARERRIVIPTFAQMRDPAMVPGDVVDRLASVGLWDIDPLNLYRITWHNEPVAHGGAYGAVNHLEYPRQLTGVEARIVTLVGKWFPTGAHKVGAAFGCLVPRLVTGQFDPTTQRSAWPSTGNYCRGGAYDASLLACDSIAILPEGMSAERFAWLASVAGEVIMTPGSESNVKEIFDKCAELRASGEDIVIFNQFDEFGNYLWHHTVTGPAMAEVFAAVARPGDRLAAAVYTTGSAGTIASGDYLKQEFGDVKVAAAEALQCPTILWNGFGTHRIEGIGDKHIPWIHNVRNTDLVTAIDDAAPLALARLFNEPAGIDYLSALGIEDSLIARFPELGISSLANLLASIKVARWFELGPDDVVLTIATDSMDMYQSRLGEMNESEGGFDATDAAVAHERWLLGETTANMRELDHWERKRIHNLKYFTWVEQQGKDVAELDRQWSDPGYWAAIQEAVAPIDELIVSFNEAVARS